MAQHIGDGDHGGEPDLGRFAEALARRETEEFSPRSL
jgi:hypothetical protein